MADTDQPKAEAQVQAMVQEPTAPGQPITVQVVQPRPDTGVAPATPGLDETVEGGDYILPDGRHVDANGNEIKKAKK